jgi:acyl-CoA thioester hydrolase
MEFSKSRRKLHMSSFSTIRTFLMDCGKICGVYSFSHRLEVRFRDIDALGHVNNAVYLSYLEQARVLYFQKLGLRDDQKPLTLLARNEIDYLRPVLLGEELEVLLRVAKIGTKSLRFEGELRAAGELAARAASVLVWYDFEGSSSIAVPDDARRKIEAFEGRSFAETA